MTRLLQIRLTLEAENSDIVKTSCSLSTFQSRQHLGHYSKRIDFRYRIFALSLSYELLLSLVRQVQWLHILIPRLKFVLHNLGFRENVINMTQHAVYTAGSRIWVQEKEKWRSAVVQENCDGKTLKFKCDDDGAIKVVTASPDTLPPLRNPDILIGLNDLTTLSYLHEPGVLFNLKYRFTEMKTIYTYCGIVLVAINPYEKLGIYGTETMWTYRGHAIGELEPHVFAVAEEAFKEMER